MKSIQAGATSKKFRGLMIAGGGCVVVGGLLMLALGINRFGGGMVIAGALVYFYARSVLWASRR